MQEFLTVLYKKIVKMNHFAPYHGCNLQSPPFSILLLTECHFSYQFHLKKYQIIFLTEVSQVLSHTP